MDLRPYQREAVEAVYNHLREKKNNPCVVLPTGCGKSLVLAQIAKDAVTLWNGRVLILAHVKELLEQNADKIRKLCPEVPIGIYSAGLKSRNTEEPVIVAGIQSVYNKADLLGRFDLIMVDECFPAGTLIDTPRGAIPIEDLYVGQSIYHALGVGTIEAISSRPTSEFVNLELSNGKTIRCTPNHPFLTENGWRKASSLGIGTHLYSREDLSCLRERVSSENYRTEKSWYDAENDGKGTHQTEVLFTGMSKRMATRTGLGEEHLALASSIGNETLPVLRKRNPSEILPREADGRKALESDAFLLDILLKESREPDVFRCGQTKGFEKIEGNRSQADDSRWERKGDATGTEASIGSPECGDGVSGDNDRKAEEGRSLELLQDGCGNPASSSGDSTGRDGTFFPDSSQDGQTDSILAGGVRVVSITHLKFESPRTVFNLQVSGHPSFFADGVLVHNCHLIPPDGEGTYRTFLTAMQGINPRVRLIGLTATPFRLKGGLICKPDNLLNEICYEAGLKEMIQQGYLSPLVSRAGRAEADLSNLHIRGGEFIGDEIEAAMDTEQLVLSACREIVDLTRDRKSVLIFTSSVKHCQHVAEAIRGYSGQECAIVTGDTPVGERAEILDRFKGKAVPADLFGNPKPPLKFLCNVNVLTTGFDAVNTDCIVLLRPTNSAGLLIQMVGRGTRLSPETGKTNCLVLDYGGNIMRHGPVDMIRVKDKTPGNGDAPAKECPQCYALIHAAYAKCPECGYEFPPSQHSDLTAHAAHDGIISGEVFFDEYEVRRTFYDVHRKRNAPDDAPSTMRVDYEVAFQTYKSEWVCPEHSGYARTKFIKWWKERAPEWCPVPHSANEAVRLANSGILAEAKKITVRSTAGEKFETITKYELGERPEREPGDDTAEVAMSGDDPHVEDFDPDDIPF